MGEEILMDRFSIEIIVKFDNTEFVANRMQESVGCNHIDNIPGTARYMGEELLKIIKQRREN